MKLKVGIYVDGAHYCYARNHFYRKNKSNIQVNKLLDLIKAFIIQEFIVRKLKVAECDFNFLVKRYSNSIDRKTEASQSSEIVRKEFVKSDFFPFVIPLVKGRQKGIDVDIAYNIGMDIFRKKLNLIVLIASDRDFKTILIDLKNTKIKSCIVNFTH